MYIYTDTKLINVVVSSRRSNIGATTVTIMTEKLTESSKAVKLYCAYLKMKKLRLKIAPKKLYVNPNFSASKSR